MAQKLGIPVEPVGPNVQINDYGVPASPALSLDAQPKGDITGRKIAVLVNDGVDDAAIASLRQLAQAARANVKIVGPRATSVTTAKGAALPVDHALSSVGSVLFDAVYVPDVAQPPAEPDPDARCCLSRKPTSTARPWARVAPVPRWWPRRHAAPGWRVASRGRAW